MAAAAAASVGIAVKTLFIVLFITMVASFAYLLTIDGLGSCFNLNARWMVAGVTDFTIKIVVIGAWLVYKESNLMVPVALIASAFLLGSVTTCGYIIVQFFKLSREESSKDPLYFVLVRRHKTDHITVGVSIVTARVIISALGCLMLGVLIYTGLADWLPSHPKPFARCIWTFATDLYIHNVILSVWVAYKESSWISAVSWVLSILCLGSIAICVYIVWQLYCLSPQQPISLLIFNNKNRDLQTNDPLLMAHPNV
ncbi:uncharacterized protein LOC112510208 [Cynara cardunculus var. scolymus]|uniref:uncharacterized protein LOC112510208 n=1 Tax=Cynara cardunculus var. scolymus TaxID=59895 RepID=UPI000D623F1E|nr:uncharacterized protein LOC112510208 [Cynara cardunculus var. scolymus]